MTGILEDEMQQAPAELPPEEAPPEAPFEGLPGQEPATPEEEEAVDSATTLAGKLLVGKGAADRFLSMCKKAGVDSAIASTGVPLVEIIDKKMDLPETCILAFSTNVAMMLYQMAARAKLVKDEDEARFSQVMQVYLQQLSTIYDFDPQEAAQILSEMEGDEAPAEPLPEELPPEPLPEEEIV